MDYSLFRDRVAMRVVMGTARMRPILPTRVRTISSAMIS